MASGLVRDLSQMELTKYTEQAIRALSGAQEAAKSFGHSFVGSEHLLMGIIKCGDNTSGLLSYFGVTEEKAAPFIDTVIGGGRNIFTDSFGNTQTAKRVLELSLYEAKSMGCDLIDTDHILLSIMRERDSVGARIVDSLCRDKNGLREALINGKRPLTEDDDEFITEEDDEPEPVFRSARTGRSSSPVLDTYTKDLTALAKLGKLDPVIGREQETARVLRTLCRRSKNNPVLIGEPGVGKSAIAEGIAELIVQGAVPDELLGARILSFDIGAMIAGTKYRGEFEQRLKTALDELADDDKAILFIDEIHTIVGAGAGEGSVDAANIMKPALARGDLRVIGATTIEEYRAYIEKDAALERRFSPILVNEPSIEQTEAILNGLKPKYEKHHNVTITEEALISAVELSEKYIADRQLPDKAIDVLDEACSAVRIRNRQDGAARIEIEKALGSSDYELAERLRQEARDSGENSIPEVTSRDIEIAVSERTGIDVSTAGMGKLLSGIDLRLKEKVFGQDEAIESISAALRRSAAGFGDAKKPFASFIFAGPAGVGKETLVGRLAEYMFNGSVFRVNGNEIGDESSAVRLIGAPLGYKDAEKGGLLTEFLRLHPVSVVRLADPDKCSRGALSVFSELISEGKVTDGTGRIVNSRNCIVIICVDTDPSSRTLGFGSGSAADESAVIKSLSEKLPSSLISLADETIVFSQLDERALRSIAAAELDRLQDRARRRGVELGYTDPCVDAVVSQCGGSASGVKKCVTMKIEDAVTRAVLNNTLKPGDNAVCDHANGEFFIRKV
ncbi:MAG: ATP-dependent Clp protease ATP-binding subunit [Clostridia bacterium]|nr:ATP-dependent Clp protease ATP-binding subunit [Clostridia bacterium]